MSRSSPKSSTLIQFLPRWSRRVVTEMGGRDPLGLSRVANMITDYLLTGIITTTNRARYYSFYCWNIWHIHHTEIPRNYAAFVASFQRREAAFALITVAHGTEVSPVGIEAVRPRLERGKQQGAIDTDFRVLPSNPLGGYGQYYRGSLYQLGLIGQEENGIDYVSTGIADALAQAFHASIASTPYIRQELFRNAHIPLNALEKSQHVLTLDAIMDKPCAEERRLLVQLFFGFHVDQPDERSLLRRATLGHILYLLSIYEAHGCPPCVDDVDQYFVYFPYYFSALQLGDETAPYECHRQFTICHELWRQFCLQQYFTQAMEDFLLAVLEILGMARAGLTPQHLVDALLASSFLDVLREKTGRDCRKPRDLLRALTIEGIPTQPVSYQVRTILHPTAENSEMDILELYGNDPGTALARAVLLLAVLYAKWRGIHNDQGLAVVSQRAGNDLWFWRLVPTLDTWLDDATTWAETLHTILQCHIVDQHDRIMYEKRRLESSWISTNEGRLFKEQDYWRSFRATRHDSALTILRDLCLLTWDEAGLVELTSDGRATLQRVLEVGQ